MPAQRQTNMHSLTAHLCEVRDSDGALYSATAVDPGESVDWPQPVAGFAGWDWQAHYAAQAAERGFAVVDADASTDVPADSSQPPAKSRPKASVKATDTTPEATA